MSWDWECGRTGKITISQRDAIKLLGSSGLDEVKRGDSMLPVLHDPF